MGGDERKPVRFTEEEGEVWGTGFGSLGVAVCLGGWVGWWVEEKEVLE